MTAKTLHLDRTFIRLYVFSAMWACLGAAIPAFARGITWLGILCLLVGTAMLVVGLHPRSGRARKQPTFVVSTYPVVCVYFVLATAGIGWFTGAIRNVVWLVYFASLLVLYGVTVAAFVRSIRRPPPTDAQHPPSSRGPAR